MIVRAVVITNHQLGKHGHQFWSVHNDTLRCCTRPSNEFNKARLGLPKNSRVLKKLVVIATIDSLTFDNSCHNHFSQLRTDTVNRGANMF